ncbi:MAG: zinc finger domain-containing protein [Nitrososphaerales archaeon]
MGEPPKELWESEHAIKLEEGAWAQIPGGINSTSVLLGGPIAVYHADGQKCERCWKYNDEIGKDPKHPTVCARCSEVLRS